MNDLKELFESHKGIKGEFYDRLKKEFKSNDLDPKYVGALMVIQKEYVGSIVQVLIEYMNKILGFNIGELGVESFITDKDVDLEMRIYLLAHKAMGVDVPGFYNRESNTLFIRIGVHFELILPILFHELTHAYINKSKYEIIDDYPKPTSISFGFKNMMYKANQNEGLCELSATIMYMYLFGLELYPSLVDEYWLGWAVAIRGFVSMWELLEKMMPSKPIDDMVRLCMSSVYNIVKAKKNLYKFVPKVPNDSYQRRIPVQGVIKEIKV